MILGRVRRILHLPSLRWGPTICNQILPHQKFSFCSGFHARKQLLLSARLSHRNSVCPSVRPSVRHTGRSVKSTTSWNHQIFTIGCLEDSSVRNRKPFP